MVSGRQTEWVESIDRGSLDVVYESAELSF